MQNRTSPPRGPRAYLWTGIRIVFALVLIGIVLSKTDLRALSALAGQLSPAWLGLTVLLFCLLTLIRTYQYYVLIGRTVPYARVLSVVISQNALTNFVAFSAGVAYLITLLNVGEGVKLSRVALSFLIAKVGDLIAVWALLLVTSLYLWTPLAPLHTLVSVLLAGMGAAILVFFAAVLVRQKFAGLVERLAAGTRLARFSVVQRGLQVLRSLADQDQRDVFRILGMGLVYSSIYMAVTVLWVFAQLRIFTASIPFMAAAFVTTLLQLLSWIPVQVFGGLGVSELSSLYLYSFFDIPQEQMAPILVGIRILFYALNLALLLYAPLNTRLFARQAKVEK